jgi:hypothetical protein
VKFVRLWRIGSSIGLASALALAITGCSKSSSDGAALAPSASSLAPSVAAPSSKLVKLAIDPKGHTSIDMPGPNEHIKAETTAASGDVAVDLMNVPNTRGTIKVDLQTLETHSFGNDDDKAQTEHARTWLEAAPKLPPDVVAANRYAQFAIRAVENASIVDLTKAPFTPGQDGKQEKKLSATVKGEFLVHQHPVDKSAEVDITFVYPANAKMDDAPERILIKSKTPMVVTLDDHDIKPRDNVGKIAKQAFNLLHTKVADTASITLDLSAAPAPVEAKAGTP